MMRLLLLLLICAIPSPLLAATKVQQVKSKNGFTAWLIEEHSLPLVSVQLDFKRSGTAYDPDGKEGRAQMVAALMDEGAGNLSSEAFSEALEERAIDLSFSVDEDMFSAGFRATSEHVADAFRLAGLALTQPRFEKEAIERIRGQMLTQLAQLEKDPGYVLQRKWEAMVYGDHPYGKPSSGTKKSVTALQKADLKQYHDRYLAKDTLLISVAGDISPKQLREWMDTYFAGLAVAAQPETTLTDIRMPEKGAMAVVKSDVPQTMAVFATQGVKRDDPAFYHAYVMNYIIGGGALNSILADELREKRGLAYSVSTYLSPMDHADVWLGSFATRNEKVGEAYETIKETLARFAKDGPTDEQLAEAKQFIIGSFVLNLDSNGALVQYLSSMQSQGLGTDYLDKRNGFMEAVNKQDVQRVAQHILNVDSMQTVLVGQPVLGKEKASAPAEAKP